MKEEKKITQADIDEAVVRLRPLAGVPPRVYLPLIYASLAAVLLFLLLTLPGIRKNGSYLAFEGAPDKSAVYVGGAYRGSTGQEIFLPSGDHDIRIEHEGFVPEDRKLRVGGRLFGSLLFPRRLKVGYSLKAMDPREFLRSAFAEYAEWSLAGKPSALYQLPPVLSDAAAALAGTGALAVKGPDGVTAPVAAAASFAADLLSATVSPESARDGLKAGVLVASAGIPGPLSLVSAARIAASALCRGKAGAQWLQDILPKAGSESLGLASLAKQASDIGGAAQPPLRSLGLGTHDFLLFRGGSLPMGGEAPSGSRAGYAEAVPAFGISRTEVTNRQWAAFIAANPGWGLSARTSLIEKGLADESYMDGWQGADDRILTNVSWHAASAYCAWLSSRTAGSYKVVLPSEGMWETAARAADNFGNVWEWMAEAYRPYPAFASGEFSGAEKAVRGGSWANPADSVSLYSRGGMAPVRSTAFLGFRPAIVER